ncbi:MAG: hypothetical protein AAGD96_18575 [Chloroflexota bacterium]
MKNSTFLLTTLGMAFVLLLVVALMERSVIGLLIGSPDGVTDQDIRQTFSALKLIVGVLPYTLGVFISVSFVMAMVQAYQTKFGWASIAVLVILFLPMFYNIVIADTAAVVNGIETTTITDQIEVIETSLMAAVQQHYLGMISFAAAFFVQVGYLFFKPEPMVPELALN